MTEWTAGYVADIGYTYGYYHELNPLRIKLAFLSAGLVAPAVVNACELGFGQGVSVNMHAAATAVNWYGNDFNPSQAAYAQESVSKAGSNAQLSDEAFAEFADRADLPDFDFICLHGIWSWVSDENRHVIVDFVARKLKVGGVLYISYNTLPGWSASAPLRHLLACHAETMGGHGQGTVKRVDDALNFVGRLLETNPDYARQNPAIASQFDLMKGQSRHYLAHEYFNKDWHPMYFAQVAAMLGAAKLQFACSANYHEHVPAICVSPEQKKMLDETVDPNFRETVRDYMVNQRFRKDYWVKGARQLRTLERIEKLRAVRVVLIHPRGDIGLQAELPGRTVALSESVYVPILDMLADFKPRSIGQIESELAHKGVNLAAIEQACLVLGGLGKLAEAQDEAAIASAKDASERLNLHLLLKARGSFDVPFLVCPVTGGGIPLDRISQLFTLALKLGKDKAQLAEFAWQMLSTHSQCVLKDGKPLLTLEDNMEELNKNARTYLDVTLPMLIALQILH